MKDKLKEAVKVYDKIASIYSKYTYHKLMQFQLTEFVTKLKGKKVLDVGCGIGRDVEYLMEDGLDVIGIDISKKMLDEAKKNVPKGKFKHMDFRKTKFKDNSFNGIWSMASLVHIDKKEIVKVLKEFNRILDEKGILYLAVHEGEGEKEVVRPEYGDNSRVIFLYKKEEMEKYLEDAGFKIMKSEVNDTEEGKRWLEIFARKE